MDDDMRPGGLGIPVDPYDIRTALDPWSRALLAPELRHTLGIQPIATLPPRYAQVPVWLLPILPLAFLALVVGIDTDLALLARMVSITLMMAVGVALSLWLRRLSRRGS